MKRKDDKVHGEGNYKAAQCRILFAGAFAREEDPALRRRPPAKGRT